MITPIYLKPIDVRKLEEALSCDDLETLVAVVDRIVSIRVKKAKVSVAELVQR